MVLSPKGEDKYEMKYVPEDFDRYDQGFFGRAKPEYIIVKGECLEKLKQQGYEMDCWQKGIPLAINNKHLVLCQDLVQVKMRNFSHFNPPEAQPQCVFFYTIVRIHLVTYSYNGYEFVSYCRKFPDIRKSSGMPACNREF